MASLTLAATLLSRDEWRRTYSSRWGGWRVGQQQVKYYDRCIKRAGADDSADVKNVAIEVTNLAGISPVALSLLCSYVALNQCSFLAHMRMCGHPV